MKTGQPFALTACVAMAVFGVMLAGCEDDGSRTFTDDEFRAAVDQAIASGGVPAAVEYIRENVRPGDTYVSERRDGSRKSYHIKDVDVFDVRRNEWVLGDGLRPTPYSLMLYFYEARPPPRECVLKVCFAY